MLRLCVAALVSVAAVSCSSPAADQPKPTTTTTPSSKVAAAKARGDIPPRFDLATGGAVVVTKTGEHRFKVELAVKNEERQRGLMYREHLADDEGMVFFFEAMQPLSFWMKNTWIPLDMIFIDDDLKIVGIVENAEPLTTNSRKVPGKDSRFVFEVRGGLTRELGIGAGDTVRFEGVPEALWKKP